MKSAVLLTAMLSGLCAEVMAAPISNIADDPRRTALAPLDNGWNRAIGPDLDFNFASDFDALADEDQTPAEPELVTTGIDFDEAISEEGFAIGGKDENAPSGSLRVPEPPPLKTIALGLAGIWLLTLCRKTRRHRNLPRRRSVPSRQITALR